MSRQVLILEDNTNNQLWLRRELWLYHFTNLNCSTSQGACREISTDDLPICRLYLCCSFSRIRPWHLGKLNFPFLKSQMLVPVLIKLGLAQSYLSVWSWISSTAQPHCHSVPKYTWANVFMNWALEMKSSPVQWKWKLRFCCPCDQINLSWSNNHG